MRKVQNKTKDRQERAIRLATRMAEKRRRLRERERRRRRLRESSGRKQYGVQVVPVPNVLLFHGNSRTREAFDAFCSSVTLALKTGRSVRLDFSNTEKLFPCGLLLLLGQLDAWLAQFPAQLSGTYPESDLVEQMLQSSGVLKKLGLSPRRAITHGDVVKWHQFEGHNVDATPMEGFMEEVRQATDLEWQTGLGDCIAEALTNVKKHAYPGQGHARWWMFATVNLSGKQVFVAMHDRGESIPGTLLAKPELIDTVTARKLRKGGDCELISAAAGGRTRTKLYYRGKGLPEMLEFTARHQANALAIYSRRGYFASREGAKVRLQGSLQHPVEGTLVIWTLNYGEQP